MAVTVTIVEWNGSDTPGTTNGDAATNLNLGATDAVDLTPASYPVKAGEYSYFKQIKANFSGSMTQISNLKVYKSAGTYVTEEGMDFSGSIVASAPSQSDQSWASIPTTLPGTANVCLNGLTTGVLLQSDQESSPGYTSGSRSDLVGFQLETGSNTPAGAVNTKTLSFVYDRQ